MSWDILEVFVAFHQDGEDWCPQLWSCMLPVCSYRFYQPAACFLPLLSTHSNRLRQMATHTQPGSVSVKGSFSFLLLPCAAQEGLLGFLSNSVRSWSYCAKWLEIILVLIWHSINLIELNWWDAVGWWLKTFCKGESRLNRTKDRTSQETGRESQNTACDSSLMHKRFDCIVATYIVLCLVLI